MPKAPEWTASLSADYSAEFNFGLLQLSATLFASDSFFWDTNERVKEDAYTTVAARASWQPLDSNVRLSIWGRNLTDEEYTKASFILESGDGISYAMPRSYGVGIEYNF
jgi:iron complex outermembrane receptor protein